MACIKSLALKGIRSFGPEDEQLMFFERPLTLIMGQNGCGKTTIIECLRYAITGQMSSGGRKCFVHDVEVISSSEVVAQTKLTIINAEQEQLEVSRSIKSVKQEQGKAFEPSEVKLSVVDATGNRKAIDSGYADFVQKELGVSKAILNSVIFCHQEESNWPLNEGMNLKNRFDEIFDVEKYRKCIDSLMKQKKKYIEDSKKLKLDVVELTTEKKNLDKMKEEAITKQSQISNLNDEVAQMTDDMEPITRELEAIDQLEKNVKDWELKKEIINSKLEEKRTQEEKLKQSIKIIFDGTTQELQGQINSHEATVKANQKDHEESCKQNTSLNEEKKKIEKYINDNDKKYNTLNTLERENEKRLDKRNKAIVDALIMAEMGTLGTIIKTDEEAEKGILDLSVKIRILHQELEEIKKAAETREKEYQQEVNVSRDALTCHNQKILDLKLKIQEAITDIKKLEEQISSIKHVESRRDQLERRLQSAEIEYQRAASELNADELQQQMSNDEKRMEKLEQEYEILGDKIKKLQQYSVKLNQLNQKQKKFNVLTKKHKTALTEILEQMPDRDFAATVNNFQVKLQRDIGEIEKKLKGFDIKITTLKAERGHVNETLSEKRVELKTAEDEIHEACGTQSYEITLAELTSSVDKLQERRYSLQSSMDFYSKYEKKLKVDRCCPLCHRAFESDTEETNLASSLLTHLMDVPAELEKVSEELQRQSAKKDELLSLKPLDKKMAQLKETDIPQLKTKLRDIDEEITTNKETMGKLMESLVEPKRKMSIVQQIHGEMRLLDIVLAEISTTATDFESVKAQCEDLVSVMTLEEAISKHSELKQNINELKAGIKAAQTKLNEHAKKMRHMDDNKSKINSELLNVLKRVQELVNLQENKREKEENHRTHQLELEKMKNEVPALETALSEKEKEISKIINDNRNTTQQKESYIRELKNSFDRIESIDEDIKQHKESNIEQEMEKIIEANEILMKEKKQIITNMDELTKSIDTLKDQINKQEIYKHNLQENLKLRDVATEIEHCEDEIDILNENLSGVNWKMISEKEELLKRQKEISTEIARKEGEMKQLQARVDEIITELTETKNVGIEKDYLEKFYELRATEAIIEDIQDYTSKLEESLIRFHGEKMEDINIVIRDMWRKIYKANDIDYIKIKTEGNILSSKSERRKYGYRVLQCKNDVEIDMRGKCSAGQKVLASLIIRLALAETFSSSFQVLALDEPTTNLDEENSRSLCSALGEIIQERKQRQNFMFIIITRDTEFIQSLRQIHQVTHYYEMSRNEHGKSRIEKNELKG